MNDINVIDDKSLEKVSGGFLVPLVLGLWGIGYLIGSDASKNPKFK